VALIHGTRLIRIRHDSLPFNTIVHAHFPSTITALEGSPCCWKGWHTWPALRVFPQNREIWGMTGCGRRCKAWIVEYRISLNTCKNLVFDCEDGNSSSSSSSSSGVRSRTNRSQLAWANRSISSLSASLNLELIVNFLISKLLSWHTYPLCVWQMVENFGTRESQRLVVLLADSTRSECLQFVARLLNWDPSSRPRSTVTVHNGLYCLPEQMLRTTSSHPRMSLNNQRREAPWLPFQALSPAPS
jgi:hypothetical protein